MNMSKIIIKEETIAFMSEYIDTDGPEERIVDFSKALDDMKRLLKDISKIKRHQIQ